MITTSAGSNLETPARAIREMSGKHSAATNKYRLYLVISTIEVKHRNTIVMII